MNFIFTDQWHSVSSPLRGCCVRCFVDTALRSLRCVSVSGWPGIRTGPSLRFPMASSQSFLLAVSSRISCCCCSDSWKVSSIFTRLVGGSATGDKSGKDTQIRLKKTKNSYSWRIEDSDSGACLRKIRLWQISNIYKLS